MAAADADMPALSEVHRALILATMAATSMLFSTTLTVVTVVLPTLQGAFSVTQDQVSWLVTLNIIAMGIGLPLTGWFAARFGRRRTLLVSVAGFILASLLCGIAGSFEAMLLFRVMQGAAASTLLALPQAIVMDTYPRERQAFALSVWGIAAVSGPAVAPSIGGLVSEAFGWRASFLMMLPSGMLAFICIALVLRESGRDPTKRLDWTGFLALAATIACLQVMFDRGHRLDWFDSDAIVLLACGAAVGFYVFLVQCATHRDPFISLRMFLDRNFAVGVTLSFIFGLIQIAPTVILPPFLQVLKGYPDSLIGLVLAMRGAGMVTGYFFAPVMTRLDPRIGIAVGAGLTVLSGLLMARFDFDTPMATMVVALLIQGVGASTFWLPMSTLTFSTIPRSMLAQGSGIFHLLRVFGSTLFVAVTVTVVVRGVRTVYSDLNQNLSIFNDLFGLPGVAGLWNLADLPGIARMEGEVVRQATMAAYHNAFLVYACAALLVVPFLLLARPPRR
ncbi:MAG: DHA2 family efflux MFS transporter permease subunit [Alphaproteobacteria bacterium]